MEPLKLDHIVSSLDTLILEPLPPENRQRFLRFMLGQDAVLLPLEQITEVVRLETANILPVPEMPHCILGICSWRGEMLWLLDFNDFVGYLSPFRQEAVPTSLMVIVIQSNQQSIGIGVQQVNDIEFHDPQQLQPAASGLFPPELLPYVLGTLPGCCDVVLNIQAISKCPLWKKHQEESV